MSEENNPEEAQRNWQLYIGDMLSFAERVLLYTDGYDQETFEQTGLNYDATVRNLELIGEAATHIPAEARAMAQNIEWRKIIAVRNRLIHGYLGIDNDTLWSIIQNEIPELIIQLKAFKKDEA